MTDSVADLVTDSVAEFLGVCSKINKFGSKFSLVVAVFLVGVCI